MLKVININNGVIVAAYSMYQILEFNPKPWATSGTEALARRRLEHAERNARCAELNKTKSQWADHTAKHLNRFLESPIYLVVDTGQEDEWALTVEANISHG